MADGRGRAEWGRVSSLLAMTANVHRDPKRRSKPYRPSDFNPFAVARRRRGTPVTAERFADDVMRGTRAVKKKRKKKGR